MSKASLSRGGILRVAMLCHTANAMYCRSLGDESQKTWDEAPDWQKASAIAGVEFHLANPDAGDAASHENWMAAKKAEGWKYGEEKDEAKKLHPCMVPFSKLPPEQQFKDTLFRHTVHSTVPLQAEIEGLERSLKAQKGQTTKVRNALENAQELVREADAGPREVAPIELPKGRKPYSARRLLELIDAAEKVEVVASDGKQEVMAVKPLEVTGTKPWRVTAVGLQLELPVWLVHGPKAGDPPYQLAGWGLFIDGKLRAYRARPRTLQMGGGQQYNLGGDVIF